jgi:malonyl CoA-acyl carrier protein transacylase
MAGHSLGEIVALVAAEAFSFEDALSLVNVRGKLMQCAGNETSQGMLALWVGPEEALQICEHAYQNVGRRIFCANFNSPNQTVIAGEIEAIRYIEENTRVLSKRVSVTKAFHTPFMKEAAEQFREYLYKIRFSDPQIAVISNVTAQPYQRSGTIQDLLYQQIYSSVRWNETMLYFQNQGITELAQTTDSTLFKYMSKEYAKKYCWRSLEDLSRLYMRMGQ